MATDALAPGIWAVVPFKGTVGAKGRLAAHLDQAERAALVLAMARDVLRALKAAPLAGIAIVSRSRPARDLAAAFGATFVAETARGLSGAVTEASAFVAARGAAGTLIIHADLPAVTSADIEALLRGHAGVTLAPDRHDIGTNCIVATPPNAMRYQFDGRSFAPHQALARAAGLEPRIVRRPGLGLDIDTLDALKDFARRPSATEAWRHLEAHGVVSRLIETRNNH